MSDHEYEPRDDEPAAPPRRPGDDRTRPAAPGHAVEPPAGVAPTADPGRDLEGDDHGDDHGHEGDEDG